MENKSDLCWVVSSNEESPFESAEPSVCSTWLLLGVKFELHPPPVKNRAVKQMKPKYL